MRNLWRVFSAHLPHDFIKSGFEIIDPPYVDSNLGGFRATYIRRYQLIAPWFFDESKLTSIVHVVGLPIGNQGRKMIILASPRDINNEPVSDTMKLRLNFDDQGHLISSDLQHDLANKSTNKDLSKHYNEFAKHLYGSQSNQQTAAMWLSCSGQMDSGEVEKYLHLSQFLRTYVKRIIEVISPGLIQLPADMKLEILMRLNVASVIRMSQVNSEFKSLIFQQGESLWKHLCHRDFNIKVINRHRHSTWMELYRDLYLIHMLEICRKERALPGLPERPALPAAPNMLQIEWLPEVLQLPDYPMHYEVDRDEVNDVLDPIDLMEVGELALQLPPLLMRVASLDSLHGNIG